MLSGYFLTSLFVGMLAVAVAVGNGDGMAWPIDPIVVVADDI